MASHHALYAVTLALAATFVCNAAIAGEPCEDNFSVSGNFVTGKTYRTTAIIPNAQARDAFDGAMSFTAGNGFTVQSSDKNAGTISAVQTSNKRVPLGILMSPAGANTKIAFSYSTPTGVHSPEDAIKKHFCSTVVAATNTARALITQSAITQPVVLAANQPPQRRGYADISSEQRVSIEAEWLKNISNESIGEKAAQAKNNATLFLERLSCLSDYAGIESLMAGTRALNEFAAPNINFSNVAITLRPMRDAKYHDKKLCMTVARISDWKSLANNALTFEVLFKADDSGETKKLRIETIRQTDGAWLFGYFQ